MSKGAKSRSAEKRKKEKKNRKEAMKALYESRRKQGINKKSKRAIQNDKEGRKVRVERHSKGRCYNVGCETCFYHDYSAKTMWKRWPEGVPHHLWAKMDPHEQERYIVAQHMDLK